MADFFEVAAIVVSDFGGQGPGQIAPHLNLSVVRDGLFDLTDAIIARKLPVKTPVHPKAKGR